MDEFAEGGIIPGARGEEVRAILLPGERIMTIEEMEQERESRRDHDSDQ